MLKILLGENGGGGGTGMAGSIRGGKTVSPALIGELCTELVSIVGQAMRRIKMLRDEKMYEYKNNATNYM